MNYLLMLVLMKSYSLGRWAEEVLEQLMKSLYGDRPS